MGYIEEVVGHIEEFVGHIEEVVGLNRGSHRTE